MPLNPVVPIRTTIPQWSFAERLRKGRRDAKLTQADIAAALGVKESTYSAWETGRNTPDIAALAPELERITGFSRMFYIGWVDGGNGPGGSNSLGYGYKPGSSRRLRGTAAHITGYRKETSQTATSLPTAA